MVRSWLVPVLLCLVALPVGAQNPAAPRRQQQQQEALLGQVVERFMQNISVQAGLSDDQMARFRAVTREGFRRRSDMAIRERNRWRALEAQMRPGIAADADSVAALLSGLQGIQEERLAAAQREQEVLAEFLNPVQRGQVAIAWRRLEMQIERVRGLRGQGGPPWGGM